jgi:rhodanese-related sulfurtransferase
MSFNYLILLLIFSLSFQYHFTHLSTGEVLSLLDNENFMIVDTRDQSNSTMGFISKTILFDLNISFSKFFLALVPKDKKIVIVCNENEEIISINKITELGYEIFGYYYIQEWIFDFLKINYEPITYENIDNLVKNNEYILDVREVDEWKETGIIKNSHTFDLSNLSENFKNIETNNTIHILCKSGKRAAIAYTYLMYKGLKNNFTDLDGGILKVIDVGYPLEPY